MDHRFLRRFTDFQRACEDRYGSRIRAPSMALSPVSDVNVDA